jgi:hypothetical protein
MRMPWTWRCNIWISKKHIVAKGTKRPITGKLVKLVLVDTQFYLERATDTERENVIGKCMAVNEQNIYLRTTPQMYKYVLFLYNNKMEVQTCDACIVRACNNCTIATAIVPRLDF